MKTSISRGPAWSMSWSATSSGTPTGNGAAIDIEHFTSPIPVRWTLLTSLFLHGSWMHLLGNMLYLWIVGDNVEEVLGPIRYFIVYLGCGLMGSLAQIAINPDSEIPNLGASGAIAGIMGAYVVWFPQAQIRVLLFRFITVLPAVIVIGGWIAMQIWLGAGSFEQGADSGGIAYLAHVGGALTGIFVAFLFAERSPIHQGPQCCGRGLDRLRRPGIMIGERTLPRRRIELIGPISDRPGTLSCLQVGLSTWIGLRLGCGWLLEDDHVLPGEEFERLLEREALGLDFEADLGQGHLVLGLDGDLGVFAAELDEDQPALRLERGLETLQDRLGIGALVVDVDHQDQVNGLLGEAGVVLSAANRLDVGDTGRSGVLAEHAQHFELDVGGVDHPLGTDVAGQADAVIAGTRADVGHGRAPGDLQGRRASPRAALPRSAPAGTASRHLPTT